MTVFDFLVGFLGAGAGAALVGFLGKDWLALRLKTAIEEETFRKRSAFEIKRAACLEALTVVDAVLSNQQWSVAGTTTPKVAKQQVDIAAARRAYSQLALSCENPDVVAQFVRVLGLRSPDEPAVRTSGDKIVDLRNAMRAELGFGKSLDLDRKLAWIANLDGAN